MAHTHYEYINMQIVPTMGKTKAWTVYNNHSGGVIGDIKWYGAWRRYCFFPLSDMVFSGGCLKDIEDFMEKAMVQWKAEKTGRA